MDFVEAYNVLKNAAGGDAVTARVLLRLAGALLWEMLRASLSEEFFFGGGRFRKILAEAS